MEKARKLQYRRYGMEICNGRIPYEILLRTSPLTDSQQQILHQYLLKNDISNRTQIKIIRLARTISDLQGNPDITDQSIMEAMKLNGVPDLKLW
ncbi:hypothetical protein [Neobacillus muris]|uniref:magnesium chelatase subunit ChlI family protein n=1 Tax=Neobacillus muris TaxID=2941334 RepID=UPI003B96CE11